MNKNLLITGGLGFIGSHVVEHFIEKYPEYNIVLVDLETYAANISFKNEILSNKKYEKVSYHKRDIRDYDSIKFLFNYYEIDHVLHLAAESHVDNSIKNPNLFIETNVIGTINILNCAKKYWTNDKKNYLFYHISTDEVYGSLGKNDMFYEHTSYDPKSPYSASKASSDHFVRAYGNTFKIPYVISNCSNNYGERQHNEKLIPKTILNLLNNKKVPVYGNGSNVRDWLYVKDHVEAIDKIFHNGTINHTYNIGGDNEISNLNLVKKIINILHFNYKDIIEYVEDRKGHDFRYAVNHDKITNQLGWKPKTSFDIGLLKTINYYNNNFK